MSLTFHHIGVACTSLEDETRRFAPLGYRPESAEFLDPVQGVRGRFLAGGGPRLELLAEAGGSGVLVPWLRQATKLYHLAYLADPLGEAIDALRGEGARLVVGRNPAVAFGGAEIAFLVLRNLLLVELIAQGETGHGGSP
jgi:methylmalonyl-CoA/ethylmalonyl-CoA epimerase